MNKNENNIDEIKSEEQKDLIVLEADKNTEDIKEISLEEEKIPKEPEAIKEEPEAIKEEPEIEKKVTEESRKIKKDKNVKIDKKSQIKYGTLSIITLIIVTALVAVVNIFSTQIWERYPLSTDVTSDGLYEMDEKTTEFLASIDKDVKITILAEEEFFAQVTSGDAEGALPKINNMIKRYVQKSSKISMEYVNILEDPALSNKYPDLSLNYGEILITAGSRVKSITLDDLLVLDKDYQTGQQYIEGYKVEEGLSLAILSVISEDLNKAVILTGFESYMTPTGVTNLLSANNYEIEEVSVMTQEIPKDANMVILGAPARDLTKEEIKKIDDFLDNDGQLDKTLYYLPYFTPESETPNIDGLLADWGIKVTKDYIYELDENRLIQMNPPYLSFLTGYKDSQLSTGLEQKPYIVSIAFALETLFETSGNRSTSVLLESSAKSYLRPIDSPEDFKYEAKGDSGPFNIMVVGEKMIGGGEIKSSRVVVNSSVSSGSESFMEGNIFGNAEYTINLFNKFHPNEYVFSVLPKKINDNSLPVTNASIRFYFTLFLIILPLVVLVVGLVIWYRRQKK